MKLAASHHGKSGETPGSLSFSPSVPSEAPTPPQDDMSANPFGPRIGHEWACMLKSVLKSPCDVWGAGRNRLDVLVDVRRLELPTPWLQIL